MNEPRKATDVLLDLENKVDILLGIIRSQDLNIKILSNKLNNLVDILNKSSLPEATPASARITIEAIDTLKPIASKQFTSLSEKQVPITSEAIVSEDVPKGFRRTSRPETYAGNDIHPNKPQTTINVPPKTDIIVPSAPAVPVVIGNKQAKVTPPTNQPSGQSVAVMQRITYENGRAVFLAEVEVHNKKSSTTAFVGKTNSMGKWSAALPVGKYKVIIRKKESVGKEKRESIQDLVIDGMLSQLELPILTLK